MLSCGRARLRSISWENPVTGYWFAVRSRASALPELDAPPHSQIGSAASPGEARAIDAVILAESPLAAVRIAGLEVRERAVRVARRIGATRVCVINCSEDRADLVAWRGGRTCPVVVIRADQLVHTPLVQPLLSALPSDGIAMAVAPESRLVDDIAPGGYAGAFVATGMAATTVVAELARGASDTSLVAAATPVPHGPVARAPVATPEQRRTAHRVLYSILVKPQDNAITRYLFRPVSFPLTRFLVRTPITPNQVSYVVAALVVLGCWLTAHASFGAALAGTIVVLVASYVDCCDGEIARLKLLSSRFGAWLDTVVDELSSVGYMAGLGWHCHVRYGATGASSMWDVWLVAVAIASVGYAWSIYCVYYNIIVAVGSANSQDYIARFDVVSGSSAQSVRLVPVAPRPAAPGRELPRWATWIIVHAPYMVRRDFLVWFAVVLVAAHQTRLCFIGLAAGGVATAVVVTIDHVKLRALRRAVLRRGLTIESPHHTAVATSDIIRRA